MSVCADHLWRGYSNLVYLQLQRFLLENGSKVGGKRAKKFAKRLYVLVEAIAIDTTTICIYSNIFPRVVGENLRIGCAADLRYR